MKKTFVIEYDYTPGQDSLHKTFGASDEDIPLLASTVSRFLKSELEADENTADFFQKLIDEGVFNGGIIMTLAAAGWKYPIDKMQEAVLGGSPLRNILEKLRKDIEESNA